MFQTANLKKARLPSLILAWMFRSGFLKEENTIGRRWPTLDGTTFPVAAFNIASLMIL
jgi:hypothetical protein